MNPENPDSKKINGCGVAIFDGLALKDKTIKRVMKCMRPLLQQKARIIVIHTDNRNKIGVSDFNEIVDKVELLEYWSVPAVGDQDF